MGKVYVKVKNLLTPKTVEPDQFDDTFTYGIYEYTIDDNDIATLVDVDNDGIDEAFVLLIQGSGRFPVFYSFKKEMTSGKFKRVSSEERNIEPADLGGRAYFIESFRDFNSGRWPRYSVLKMNNKMGFEPVATISEAYSYNLDPDVGKYITSQQLNQIAYQDYSFLGKR